MFLMGGPWAPRANNYHLLCSRESRDRALDDGSGGFRFLLG